MKAPFAAVYLTVDQVMSLHEEVIAATDGCGGLRSHQDLASSVLQPQQSFGEDLYPTVHEKAAAYGFFIAENQPFLNGNKRTAAAAMLVFLDINGLEFHQSDDEIAEMFEDLGSDKIDQSEFFGWVCNHAKPKPGLC